MANTKELRSRIKSVKNTAQITKAMQMVAATKMRRAQNQALSGRPYTDALNFALSQLTPRMQSEMHKLLSSNTSSKVGIILLTTDKALCGSLNTNVLKTTISFIKDRKNISFYTIGKKGRNFVVRTGSELIADFENTDTVTFRQGAQIGRLVTKSFLENELGEVYLIYPDFVSTLRQDPKVIKLLPLDGNVILNVSEGSLANASSDEQSSRLSTKRRDSSAKPQNDSAEFLFEPSPADLLDYILNHFIETKIYQALLETKASEHSARMIAMQNATDNAKELVSDLQLAYNQTRQEGITRELLEITSASAALE